jgi:ATP-binding cassette subfamily C (CFTR/MRP) protein 2
MSFIVNYSAIAYVIVFGNNNPALTGMLFTIAVVIDNSLQSVVATIGQAET